MGEDSDVEDVHGFPPEFDDREFFFMEGCARAGPRRSDEDRDNGRTTAGRQTEREAEKVGRKSANCTCKPVT